jgi:hypothetical protein
LTPSRARHKKERQGWHCAQQSSVGSEKASRGASYPLSNRPRAQVLVAVKHWHFATPVQGEQPHAFSAVHGVFDRPPQTLSLRHSSDRPKQPRMSLRASVVYDRSAQALTPLPPIRTLRRERQRTLEFRIRLVASPMSRVSTLEVQDTVGVSSPAPSPHLEHRAKPLTHHVHDLGPRSCKRLPRGIAV